MGGDDGHDVVGECVEEVEPLEEGHVDGQGNFFPEALWQLRHHLYLLPSVRTIQPIL